MTRLFAAGAVGFLALIVGAAAVAVLIGRNTADQAFDQCRATAVAGGPGSIGGPFELISETGALVTSEEVLTEPALIYFGYTFCPDVCPFDTVRNAQAAEILAERGEFVLPVFISVDPARDTPEELTAFTDAVHPEMLGLTGTEEQVAVAAAAYRVYYRSHDDGEDPFYLVDHSTQTYLVLPEHGYVEFFGRQIGPEEMADRVGCFIDAAP